MESIPTNNPQPRFESAPESLKPGNVLTYHKDGDTGYFISQFGWKVDTLPDGVEIRTRGFSLVPGVGMPECTGTIVHKDDRTLFVADVGLGAGFEAKFFDGDIVEIVSVPNTEV